jgi:biopolymer transport protein ExbD
MAITFKSTDSSTSEMMVEMNSTPLIDVMLVLLIMLIITIPIPLQSVNIEMPSGPAQEQTTEPLVVHIAVTGKNAITWNDQALANRADLEQRLLFVSKASVQPEIHISAAANAPYETVAMVLAASQRQGLEKIGIVGTEQFARPQ